MTEAGPLRVVTESLLRRRRAVDPTTRELALAFRRAVYLEEIDDQARRVFRHQEEAEAADRESVFHVHTGMPLECRAFEIGWCRVEIVAAMARHDLRRHLVLVVDR